MRISLIALCTFGIVSLAFAPHAASPTPTIPKTAELGEPAPDFTLLDLEGKQHSLKDHEGHIVVLEWFSASCPYSGKDSQKSIHAKGRSAALHKNLKEVDGELVYLLIDSTARRKSKDEVIGAAKAAQEKWKIEAPILIDYSGDVGHLYKAQTTPHMFVIDAAGVLRYQGAFDADKRGSTGGKAPNHVLEAVKKLKAGEAPDPARTRPWGCGVKYKN